MLLLPYWQQTELLPCAKASLGHAKRFRPRWPGIGAALAVEYEVDGSRLHGPSGLGGASFPCAQLHHQHSSDKLLIDLVRQHPKDITVICLGPLTVLARAFDRDPELPFML